MAILAVLAATGGVLGTLALRPGKPAASSSCPRPLSVVAAPEIAPAVAITATRAHLGGCGGLRVTSADPAAVAEQLRAGDAGSRPDVWIPDSSLWLSDVSIGASRPRIAAHVATSPVVLAVPPALAGVHGAARSYRELLDAAASAQPVLLVTGRAPRSAPALTVLASLYTRFGGDPAERPDLAALLRAVPGTPLQPGGRLPLRPQTVDGAPLAFAASEQAVVTANRAAGRALYRAVYPDTPRYSLDYPFVVLRGHGVPAAASRLLSALQSPSGSAALENAGFRWSSGAAGPELAQQRGVSVRTAADAGAPDPSVLAATLRGLALVTKSFRMLAVIDVSGSMATPVPGQDGSTRIDIARAAAAEGLGLLPDGSSAGLWEFSADLTPSTDYKGLAPLRPLNPVTRGDLAAAIQQLRPVPDGGTGLYDTVLAAVDDVRRQYDPTRVDSVVVLTDGKDEADANHRIALDTLLQHLSAQARSATPVRVVTIAYGPDSDAAALQKISLASGGTSYRSTDPRDLPKIFREAVGARLCQESC